MIGSLQFADVSLGAYLVAFVGGAVSFLSPCVLPMAPGYLAVLSGSSLADFEHPDRSMRRHIAATTLAFITGFAAIFTILGMSAGALGGLFVRNQAMVTRISGYVMIAMGSAMAASTLRGLRWLNVDRRFHPSFKPLGRLAPVVVGAAFGFGWSPCIGPTLYSVLAIASAEGRSLSGATLLFTYSLGLGVPFLATGLAFGHLARAIAFMRKRQRGIVLGAAAIMVAMGSLLATNNLVWLSAQLSKWLADTPFEFLVELG